MNDDVRELIVRDVFAKAFRDLGIGLEGNHTSFRPNNPRGKEREKSDVCPDIIKDHPGPEISLQGGLHFGFTTTLQII